MAISGPPLTTFQTSYRYYMGLKLFKSIFKILKLESKLRPYVYFQNKSYDNLANILSPPPGPPHILFEKPLATMERLKFWYSWVLISKGLNHRE